jgi:4-amino-4-deoxy-L-arabinose transferase-like glycosyltransferase
MVPICAPGLPLIMAASAILCGPCGPFYVAPFFGALLVALTWLLGYRLTGSGLTSAIASLLMAASPAFLLNLVVPMSDVAAAALWVAALTLLTWPHLWPALLGGIVAGVAVLVRPNLAPLCLAGALAAVLWPVEAPSRTRRGLRALLFLLGAAPGAITVGIVNDHLYGSPLASGYPPLSELYAISRFPRNLWRYARWLAESQGAVVPLALVPLVLPRARPAWLTRARTAPVLAFVGILAASYFFYSEFDVWWYLRFFLPAFPFLFILSGAALAWLVRIPPAQIGVPLCVAAVVLLVQSSIGFTLPRGLRETGEGEQRYVAVAQYVEAQLPRDATIIAMQHSGAIAFYTGRTVIRYDYLPRDRLRFIVDWLAANGHPPYVVLEEWEEVSFRRHFSRGQDAMGRLDVALLAETAQAGKVRIYDPRAPANPSVPPQQLTVMRTRSCAGPGPGWR